MVREYNRWLNTQRHIGYKRGLKEGKSLGIKEGAKQELKELRLLCSALDDTSIYRVDDIRIYIDKRLLELEGKGK